MSLDKKKKVTFCSKYIFFVSSFFTFNFARLPAGQGLLSGRCSSNQRRHDSLPSSISAGKSLNCANLEINLTRYQAAIGNHHSVAGRSQIVICLRCKKKKKIKNEKQKVFRVVSAHLTTFILQKKKKVNKRQRMQNKTTRTHVCHD